MSTADPHRLVTVFLRADGELLLCRLADPPVGSPQQWDGLSRSHPADQSVVATATATIEAACDLSPDCWSFARGHDDPVALDYVYADTPLRVFPVLVDVDAQAVRTDESITAAEWCPATAIHRRDTRPWLWDSYQQVAPTVHSIAADNEHGAAFLSIRALEVLRDRAGVLATTGSDGTTAIEELRALGRRLQEVRPSMAVLQNRVGRVLAVDSGPAAVETAAIEAIDDAVRADHEAAMTAHEVVADQSLLTLSWSGTVRKALQSGGPAMVYIAESRPACEGIDTAEALAPDLSVTVHTDAAIGSVLAQQPIDAVLVGADTILPSGAVVNKTGTRTAAVVAAREDIPVYVTATVDKLTRDTAVNRERGEQSAIYDGDGAVDVHNPLFDVTDPSLIAGYATERGLLTTEEVRTIAAELPPIPSS